MYETYIFNNRLNKKIVSFNNSENKNESNNNDQINNDNNNEEQFVNKNGRAAPSTLTKKNIQIVVDYFVINKRVKNHGVKKKP